MISHFLYGVIDIHVVLSSLGAASLNPHKYPPSGFDICDVYSHICLYRWPGELTSLSVHNLTSLTGVHFYADRKAAMTYIYHHWLSASEINGVDVDECMLVIYGKVKLFYEMLSV